MTLIAGAARWLWGFLVGDDPITALGVVAALALTAIVASAGIAAWWIAPLAVLALLAMSLRRASR